MDRRTYLRTLAGTIAGGTLGARQANAQQLAPGDQRWAFETDASIGTSSPAVVRGTVYVGGTDGNLYAVEAASGEQQWVFETDGDSSSSPAVVNGTVYVGNRDGNLYALDAASGEQQWTFETANWDVFSPTVADGTVYAGSTDGTLHAIDAARGTERWTFETGDRIDARPTVVNGTVYVGSQDTSLYAVDATTGDRQWAFETGGRIVRSSAAVVGGTVYVGSFDNVLYAVDAATGTQEWRFRTGSSIDSSPAVLDDTVYVGSSDDNLYAVNTATGTERWVFEAENWVRSSPAVVAGTVYVGSRDSNLYAVDAASGEQRWEFATGGGIFSSPTVVDRTVYVGSNDGSLYAVVSAPTSTPTPSPTPSATATPSPTSRPASTASASPTATPAKTTSRPPATPNPNHQTTVLPGVPDEALGSGVLAGLGGLAYGVARRMGGGDDDTGGDRNRSDRDQPGHGSGADPAASGSGSPGDTSASPSETADTAAPSPDTEASTSTSNRISTPKGTSSGPPPSVPQAPVLSLSFDDIERGERLGAGGDADVYEAVVSTPDGPQQVALKQPRFEGTLHEETVDRFAREAETWGNLADHDNVVGVVDWGTEPLPWLALEYMNGGDLGTIAGDLPIGQAVWTALGVVEGIRHAHTRGVAHLDLKPTNVLLRETDGWPVPKVADWGLARLMLESSRSIEGLSPAYAAPEQFAEDRGEVGQLTDIYQVGAVLYELFTGEPPYDGPPVRVMNDVLSEGAPDPQEVAPSLPDTVCSIITTAMASEQRDRYDDILYLRDELAAVETADE